MRRLFTNVSCFWGGLCTFVVSMVTHNLVAHAAPLSTGEPPVPPTTITDVAGAGSAVVVVFTTVRYLGPQILEFLKWAIAAFLENAKAARDERERIRKDRLETEKMKAQIEANQHEIVAANERARIAEEKAREAESKASETRQVVDGVRERRHTDVIDQNRYMIGTGAQVNDNTAVLNQLLIGVSTLAKAMNVDVGIPAPVEPILTEIPPPVAHIEPIVQGPTSS